MKGDLVYSPKDKEVIDSTNVSFLEEDYVSFLEEDYVMSHKPMSKVVLKELIEDIQYKLLQYRKYNRKHHKIGI